MTLRTLAPALLIVLAVGCASAPKDRKRTVKIDSDPPGARIFFGAGTNEGDAERKRSYIGTTPLTWITEGNDEGEFETKGALVYSVFVPGAAVFFAEPPANATNLFKKKQVFHGGGLVNPPDKIPEGVFFDLTKP